MKLDIYLRFTTRPGQCLKIAGDFPGIENKNTFVTFPMSYKDQNYWHVALNFTKEQVSSLEKLNYQFVFEDELGNVSRDWCKLHSIPLGELKTDLLLVESWIDMGAIENVMHTVPFNKIFSSARKPNKIKGLKKKTFRFMVDAPMLPRTFRLGMIGSEDVLGRWSETEPFIMKFNGSQWIADLEAPTCTQTFAYKYCLLDAGGNFMGYEAGENRIFQLPDSSSSRCLIQDGFARFENKWRGAGIAIPVFSLRSMKSLGVGEFTDIKLLVDWASQVSLKMIQLLPVNDTTSTHTKLDSYPYAAISAFALHPMYASIEAIAGKKYAKIIKSHLSQRNQLNSSEGVDYETVMELKWDALSLLYRAMKDDVFQEESYGEFFLENKDWLVPYAAFSYLRDTNGTPKPAAWGKYSIFNEALVKELCAPGSPQFDDIALHYFIQYQLHLQLKDAHEHANKNGVILKGDIAIGVHRNGVDTWTQPSRYNLDMQAGAPPDDFAVKGQNWGFPTYNWETMKSDGFAWWRQRFKQMSNYFDAFRIDHILGFFRIWSIPAHAVEGIMGRFVPAIPVLRFEFEKNGVPFDIDRYCKPYITDAVIWQMAGGLEAEVKYFLQIDGALTYRFLPNFDTQEKIEQHFLADGLTDTKSELKQMLFNLHSNVILWQEKGKADAFHFRFNAHKTLSFQQLDNHIQKKVFDLYNDYFFHRQEHIWETEAMEKLPALKQCTDMLICGEDLGLVPRSVPKVMNSLGFLSMEVQRMPKQSNLSFFDPINAPYLSVVTPSTHDMSTIREWWLEDRSKTQEFYNEQLWQHGDAPTQANAHMVRAVVLQHLASPAMWSVFQLQDLFSMDESLRLANPYSERINIPGNSKHYWRFRMHIPIEKLIKKDTFNEELKYLIHASNR